MPRPDFPFTYTRGLVRMAAKRQPSDLIANVLLLLLLPFGVLVVTLLWVHSRDDQTVSAAISSCGNDGKVTCGERTTVDHKIGGCTAHYNQTRHECLVETFSREPRDGGISELDEVLDAKSDAVIASRIANSHIPGMRDDVVISGAPVPLDHQKAAEIWFDDLMRR